MAWSPVVGVGVAHLDAVAGVAVAGLGELMQRRARALVGIVEDRRGGRPAAAVDGQQIGAVARAGIAFRLADRLLLLLVPLDEGGIQQLDHRDVEPVEPEHRLVGVVAVVVPGHVGRDDEIAGRHEGTLAVHGRVRALAFEHEAQRRLRVAVGGGHLVRHDELHAGIERGGDLGLAAHARVFQDQHAPLGLLGGDQRAGLQHGLADLVEAPQRRLAAALGLGRDRARRARSTAASCSACRCGRRRPCARASRRGRGPCASSLGRSAMGGLAPASGAGRVAGLDLGLVIPEFRGQRNIWDPGQRRIPLATLGPGSARSRAPAGMTSGGISSWCSRLAREQRLPVDLAGAGLGQLVQVLDEARDTCRAAAGL